MHCAYSSFEVFHYHVSAFHNVTLHSVFSCDYGGYVGDHSIEAGGSIIGEEDECDISDSGIL